MEGRFYRIPVSLSSIIFGWGLTAFLLSRFIPDGMPPFNANEEPAKIEEGGKIINWTVCL